MKYSINDFNNEFPTDEACLDHVFKSRFPRHRGYKKIKGRLCYGNSKGRQIYPLVGTPFENSSTPLKLWFYAVFLFSQSKHGVSAKELERQLGVTYKCAWRMANKIRSQMKPDRVKLKGVVECDEAYVGGKRRLNVQGRQATNKTPVFGIVERGGKVFAQAIDDTQRHTLYKLIQKKVAKKSKIMTDGYISYVGIDKKGYDHKSVNHTKWEYVRQEGKLSVNTNTIEGFWSGLKRQINGTHHSVGKQYLPSYINEVSFRYNHRGQVLFPLVLQKVLT